MSDKHTLAAADIEAILPCDALRMAAEFFAGHFHVSAGDDLIEYFRYQSLKPCPSSVAFHSNQIPYRRGHDRELIPPMVGDQLNPAWLNAPVEYIRCYADGRGMFVPVVRPPTA